MPDIYPTGFWDSIIAAQHHVHYPVLAQWIVDFLTQHVGLDEPIYDFGCGMGHYLAHLQSAGFTNLTGFEGDPPMGRVFERIQERDLTEPFTLRTRGHIICLEVGEHIPSEYFWAFQRNLFDNCDEFLILSWATPGQDGFGHVNCLENYEIVSQFMRIGFRLLEPPTRMVRRLDFGETVYFKNTLFVFHKDPTCSLEIRS